MIGGNRDAAIQPAHRLLASLQLDANGASAHTQEAQCDHTPTGGVGLIHPKGGLSTCPLVTASAWLSSSNGAGFREVD